jgi:hypothetical protein
LELSDGIHDVGGIRWQLFACLIAAWLILFLSICKGVKSLGKVVYVTATAPYIFLTILLIRGLLLPGSAEGIWFYITPDYDRLMEFTVPGNIRKKLQPLKIFISSGLGRGMPPGFLLARPCMGRPHHNG